MSGQRKRLKSIQEVIERLGFTCNSIEIAHAGHVCCHITDDAGNKFKAFTGQSCSASERNARLNFKQDIRRMSNRMKGLIG